MLVLLQYSTLIGWNINYKKMSTGDSLSVIESCLDLPGALKLYFVHGGFSDGIYEQGKVERGDEEPAENPRVFDLKSLFFGAR